METWNWTKRGTVLTPETGQRICGFPSSVEYLGNGSFCLYYSLLSESPKAGPAAFRIGRAIGRPEELKPTLAHLQETQARGNVQFTLGGLPAEWHPIQPIHLRFQNGVYRIYFWAHGDGVVRFLAADSKDDVNFNVVNASTPCLYHYVDRATPQKLPELGVAADVNAVVSGGR